MSEIDQNNPDGTSSQIITAESGQIFITNYSGLDETGIEISTVVYQPGVPFYTYIVTFTAPDSRVDFSIIDAITGDNGSIAVDTQNIFSGDSLFVSNPTDTYSEPGGWVFTGGGPTTLNWAYILSSNGETAVNKIRFINTNPNSRSYTAENGGVTVAIDDVTPCYRRGAHIRTSFGDTPVESLSIGDRVLTVSGQEKSIRWIGRRSYNGRFIQGNRNILPICFKAGSLGDEVPVRDLWLSPEHALFLDGSLVPARLLINNITIFQPPTVDHVEYFHIELDDHDVLLAEGAAAESFMDCDNRAMFVNGSEYDQLYPHDNRDNWRFCAPRLDRNSAPLQKIRTKLYRRATILSATFTEDPALCAVTSNGYLEPSSRIGYRYIFDITSATTCLQLASRTVTPADTDEFMKSDIRELGVPIKRIQLRGRGITIEAHHGNPLLCHGFHEDEGTHQWTNGLAHLPDHWLRAFPTGFLLEVELNPTELLYPIGREEGRAHYA